jgi:hypothetical protein
VEGGCPLSAGRRGMVAPFAAGCRGDAQAMLPLATQIRLVDLNLGGRREFRLSMDGAQRSGSGGCGGAGVRELGELAAVS